MEPGCPSVLGRTAHPGGGCGVSGVKCNKCALWEDTSKKDAAAVAQARKQGEAEAALEGGLKAPVGAPDNMARVKRRRG